MKVIDANNLIVGRMASAVAKELKRGESIIIVNAEKSIITGNKVAVLRKYKERRERSSIVNPARHGPFFPRTPEGIIRRAVRGMLPYKKAMGKEAFKRLKVFVGQPEEFKTTKFDAIANADVSKLKVPKYIKLKELSGLL